MKLEIKKTVEVEVKYLQVRAGVRYWEDSTVNGEEDTEGELIPLREGDDWCPCIDVDNGQIQKWPQGTTADIHYKVCDDGDYSLLDKDGNEIAKTEGYVPDVMCPGGDGYGDYIIMKVDANGFIEGWDTEHLGELRDDGE